MRKRISRALLTATAAGAAITTVGFMAGTAGASTHKPYFTPSAPQTATNANGNSTSTNGCGASGDETGTWTSADCGKTGYVATGRDFRYAQALVTIPNHTGAVASDPMLYVSLDASHLNNDYARVGVEPCAVVAGNCTASHWEAFYSIEQNGTTLGGTASISTATEGDGVMVSVYLEPTGNSVHVVVTPPSGTVINTDIQVAGPTYTDAQAFADWTDATTQPAPVQPVSDKTRDTQFEEGQFTTASGVHGTFKGAWTLNAVDATSNGSLPPSGTLIAQPSYLWNDGHGSGADDAFGVWRFPF